MNGVRRPTGIVRAGNHPGSPCVQPDMDLTTPVPPTAPITAIAHNRAGTISVRTTDDGLPVELRIDPRERRYGAGALADEILALNRVAAQEAATLRHRELHEQGVPREVLDRMRHFSYGDARAAHRS